jgi:glucokinase
VILAGDIGGTSTRLALFQIVQGSLNAAYEKVFSSRLNDGIIEVVRQFSAEHGQKVEQACFGLSGPVLNGRGKASNLSWFVDAGELRRELGIQAVFVINDLEANAYGISALAEGDFVVLNQGSPSVTGNAAVISAGTGLGEAGLFWDGERHHPFATEGGHVDFAPRNALESDLLRYLEQSYAHVSYERVLSGPGLLNIYRFLRDTGRAPESAVIEQAMRTDDPSAVIAQAALAASCPLCEQALDVFVSIYGAAAGNLLLKLKAIGGLYLGGGIAPKIIEKLKDGRFLEAYTAKGRLSPLCEATTVRVITNAKAALVGAARYCALQAKLLN